MEDYLSPSMENYRGKWQISTPEGRPKGLHLSLAKPLVTGVHMEVGENPLDRGPRGAWASTRRGWR